MRTFFSNFLLLLFFFFISEVSPFDSPNRFTKSLYKSQNREARKPQEYFELSLPLPSDEFTPSCTHPILRHSFANTINSPPFSTPYAQPQNCPSPPWSSIALEFRAKCHGEQYDRIAALWLGAVEIFRTSTAEPTQSGIFWKVRRDVTRFSSVLSRSDLNLTAMLENVVDDEFTGIYHVEVDLLFYNQTSKEISGGRPADLILPISDSGERGFWFRSESETDTKITNVTFPRSAIRAVMELCVSFHGNDEFWYSNPPNSYVEINKLDTGRANGAFREVFVTVDGELAGSEHPFPVIFTGGINPLFWEPMVAIGAFNLPSYDIELTPFLGKVLDEKPHEIGIGVSEGIAYWLVNANLHLWLDTGSNGSVEAKSSPGMRQALSVERAAKFQRLDGTFRIKAERTLQSSGWVKWSGGDYTASFSQHYKLKNRITFTNNGTEKTVDIKLSVSKALSIVDNRSSVLWRESHRKSFPMKVVTARLDGRKEGEYVLVTNVSHSVKGKSLVGGGLRRYSNVQDCIGWMKVKGHSVLSGRAETRQSLMYRDMAHFYHHTVIARDGKVVTNDTSLQSLYLPLPFNLSST